MNKKQVNLQQREYVGADDITKYKQCGVNIPDSIIQKMGWKENQDQLVIVSTESKKGKKRIILNSKD